MRESLRKKRVGGISTNSAQLTIFIILGIIILVSLVFLFLYLKPKLFSTKADIPRIESCVSKSLDSKIQTLSLNGGLINPQFKQTYMRKNYTFLCYTDDYYQPCVNQLPMPISTFENSLKELLSSEFMECYYSSIEDLKRRGYDVSSGDVSFELSILPNRIHIDVNAPISVSTDTDSSLFRGYSFDYKTNLYELLSVAISLVQDETYYGDSDQLRQMLYYPNIHVIKHRLGNSVKIYTLVESDENIKYQFAIKSRPYPAGELF